MILEYCGGGDLNAFYRTPEFTNQEFARICQEIFSAVCFLHRRKLAHLDLKPKNVSDDSACFVCRRACAPFQTLCCTVSSCSKKGQGVSSSPVSISRKIQPLQSPTASAPPHVSDHYLLEQPSSCITYLRHLTRMRRYASRNGLQRPKSIKSKYLGCGCLCSEHHYVAAMVPERAI